MLMLKRIFIAGLKFKQADMDEHSDINSLSLEYLI